MRRPSTARAADADVWAWFAQQVVPMRGRKMPPAPETPPPIRPIAPTTRVLPTPVGRAVAVTVGTHPPGVDSATWHRFRAGKLAAVRTLDLHGRTAQPAFHALTHFIRSAHADRLRCVEIITGRGAGEMGGVLRRELPMWLNLPDLRPLILAAAHPHAANTGSVRLLLRRVR